VHHPGAGQADEATFGGGIHWATSAAVQIALGGGVVDDSAVASDHVGQHGPGKQERSVRFIALVLFDAILPLFPAMPLNARTSKR
jgi:hypothetical protein